MISRIIPKFFKPAPARKVSLKTFFVFVCFVIFDHQRVVVQAEDAAVTDAAGVEFFEKQVRPLLLMHCYECHSAADINGGLSVESRHALLQGGDTGPAIVPGQAEKSLFIEAVRYQNRDLQMPPQNQLKAEEIKILEEWVNRGAPDPRSPETAGSPAPTGMSIVEGKQFWSFQPVQLPHVPEVTNVAWSINPIDNFILSRLEGQGLLPAEPADKRTLIRRVTYDLTGLPPTPSEIAAFLQDESPEAYSNLIERLLASPQYGVRWGRHWLDVARYADSNGLDENLAFGNAWRYRDYVIDAYNADLPFDQFVKEQLAGDLLPYRNQQTLTATGFLVLGAKVLAEPDREKLEMDTIDEQLDSMGKAFLGMTFGCVRCHDHKFDPIKQTDYYSLAAIFKSTKSFADSNTGAIKHWYEHPLATPEVAEQIKEVEQEIAAKNKAASQFKSAEMARIRNEAKQKAVDYLVAAAQFTPEMTLNEVAVIAAADGLHPRILHHCRLFLSYSKEHPCFVRWHELLAAGEIEGIASHYRDLFARAEQAWQELKQADPQAKTLPDEQLESARQALLDPSGFITVPPKPEFAFSETVLTEYNNLMEQARLFESQAADLPAVMGVTDGEISPSLPVHIRGSHRNLGEPVPREFPQVMRVADVRPVFPYQQSGRLQLAEWIASSQHPLTARVYVNRIWRWHFGQGLVRTPDNFGLLGERPTHPELLDWLAYQLMASGWSTKAIHRLILQSRTYQMASAHADAATLTETDPENRLLWKFPLQRLDAEQIRDALLAVSGQLDTRLSGKSVPLRNRQFVFNHTSVDHTKYDSLRRAAYLPIIRNNLYTLFEQFDFPDPTMPTGHRQTTTVAPQALLMMNSELIQQAADRFASNSLEFAVDRQGRIRFLYETAYGRLPASHEVERAERYLAEWEATLINHLSNPAPADQQHTQQQAWSLLCQSILASNEFLYVR